MLQLLRSQLGRIGVLGFLFPHQFQYLHFVLRESFLQGLAAGLLDAAGQRVLAGEHQLEGYKFVVRLEVFDQPETDYVLLVGGMNDATQDVDDLLLHVISFQEPRS